MSDHLREGHRPEFWFGAYLGQELKGFCPSLLQAIENTTFSDIL
jgi:hypothetical protein